MNYVRSSATLVRVALWGLLAVGCSSPADVPVESSDTSRPADAITTSAVEPPADSSLAPKALTSNVTASTAVASTVPGNVRPSFAARPTPANFTQPTNHQKMVALIADFSRTKARRNRFFGEDVLLEARQEFAALPPSTPDVERFKLQARLANLELQMGNEKEAIQLFDDLYAKIPQLGSQLKDDWTVDALFYAGVGYLRYAETQNCCLRFNADSCLLPIRGGGVHTDRVGSERAIEFFKAVLARSRPTAKIHLETIWLLNIAYMTLGEYPQNVPEEYRVPVTRFEAPIEFPRFDNVAPDLGLDEFSMSGGVVAEDFDNDGHCDIFVSPYEPSGQLKYYRNSGDGKFVDITDAAGLKGVPGGLNMIQTDYNNDGFVDVLVLRGGWWDEGGDLPSSLLRNNGDSTFTDVTIEAGLANIVGPTQAASWSDYDLDGDLDVFIGREAVQEKMRPSQLYRNNGDGTFTDVAAEAGVTNDRFCKGATFGDVNNDRYPDLFISNLYSNNRLYINQKDGTFREVTEQAGLLGPTINFPCWFWDYNNDGNLDLFNGSFDGWVDRIAEFYLFGFSGASQSHIYRGDGTGKFVDVSAEVGFVEPGAVMGSNLGDVNGDGYQDFYLGTGAPPYYQLMPNKLYINQGGTKFLDVSVPAGMSNLQKGHAVAMADFDHDGDLDVFHQLGGAYPGDRYTDQLYRNPGFGNHWLGLRLIGKDSNRRAIGTKIKITLNEGNDPQVIHREVSSGGSFGASPLEQVMGVGHADRIERVELFWPRTGKTQVINHLELDRTYEIEEGSDTVRDITQPKFQLGK